MCDTFAATASATADGAVIFGKNSDREANEAQALEVHPAGTHPPGARLRCTYIEIPQVAETRAVLLCRPFWMWGAEMGANASGLVIGNEAVWTRMPLDRAGGLTGMDLLRLALERADSAEQGIAVIAALLHDFGQGGICGFRDRRMAYHNSFILADPQAAWVMETAGPYWAARQIRGSYAISNGLTLGENVDLMHGDLAGLAAKGKALHFARQFSDRFYTFFSASGRRRSHTMAQLAAVDGRLDIPAAIRLLQDHGTVAYRPDSHWLGDRICAHAANGLTRNATQTTGSLVAHLHPDRATIWVTGTAAPCTSIFKPVWFYGEVLPDIGPPPGEHFDAASLWWSHEQYHRGLLLDFDRRSQAGRPGRQALQDELVQAAGTLPDHSTAAFSAEAFERAREWTAGQIHDLCAQTAPAVKPPGRAYRRYWEKLNRLAGMPAPGNLAAPAAR